MKATVTWQGDMLMQGETESGYQVMMDGNKKKASSPMELVLLAAGGCSSIDVTSILEKARQDIKGCQVEITSERADAVPAVFTKIHLNFVVTGNDMSEKHVARAVNMSMEKYCSVSIMLGKAVEITHSYEIKAA